MPFNFFGGGPQDQALLAVASGMLESGGPSRMPISIGQGAARSMLAGREVYNQAHQARQQEQLFALKMAEAKQQQMAEAQKRAALAELSRDPRFAQLGPLLQIAPGEAIKQAYPEAKVVAPGASLVAPNRPESALFTAPARQEDSPLAKLIREREAVPASDPRRGIYDAAIAKATTQQPLVNVDTRQETAFGKELGQEFGKQYSDLLRADFNAPATIGKYQRLSSLLTQAGPGKFKGTTTGIKAAAKGLGIDLAALGVSDDVAPAQAATALTNQLALELRNPAGGAGMPGALSDRDREFLMQSVPGLENDPAAIPLMIEYRVKLAQREQDVARMARSYKKRTGKFDEGFYQELADWSGRNPLFAEQRTPATIPKTPANRGFRVLGVEGR